MFFLRNRRGERYAPDWRAIKPGHPIYEKIRAEAIAQYQAEDEAVEEAEMLESLDRYLRDMRRRRFANDAILAEGNGSHEVKNSD
jgi:hypothetical protein